MAKIISKKTVHKGKFLRVVNKEFLTGRGKRGVWECIERKNSVSIFPLTEKEEVVLEKIFRVPLNSYVISLPAGFKERNETGKTAAKRELLEETGYLAKKLIPLFHYPVIDSLTTEETDLFFAPKVKDTGKLQLEDAEEIEVIRVPLKELPDFLLNPPKKVKVDIKIFGALAVLEKKNLI